MNEIVEPGSAGARLLQRLLAESRATRSSVLSLVNDLSDDQLRRRAGPHSPSIAFHVWHLARWADHDAHRVKGVPQIWQARDLAAAWRLGETLGEADAGTEMGDDASEHLVLPEKAALIGYARDAFAAVDDILEAADVAALLGPASDATDGVAELISQSLTHDLRHLGMIEALRGVLGLRGTATR